MQNLIYISSRKFKYIHHFSKEIRANNSIAGEQKNGPRARSKSEFSIPNSRAILFDAGMGCAGTTEFRQPVFLELIAVYLMTVFPVQIIRPPGLPTRFPRGGGYIKAAHRASLGTHDCVARATLRSFISSALIKPSIPPMLISRAKLPR